MLKLFFALIFMTLQAWGSEPQEILIVSKGHVQKIYFKDLKKTEIVTLNYHPKFKTLGKIKYSGYLIKDILKNSTIKSDDSITILGKTGQFSVEVSASELLTGKSFIATHINGETVKTDENGLQIIYSQEALEKYPHLKERQYWCWWVRSFITDSKFVPYMRATNKPHSFQTIVPWPVPYGISSRGSVSSPKLRNGVVLSGFNKLKVELLNGSRHDIVNDGKTKYFLADPISNKAGGYGLHQLVEQDGKIETIVSNLYYVKSLQAVP